MDFLDKFEPWVQFKQFIFEALLYLHGLVGDWGMAIILLTVAIRVLLIPLTWKQTKSMLELQRIQPKMKELQAKYKDDKEKLQEETMKFYQENKVNPFGGCLPALLQMPVFIGLYSVLGYTGANKPGPLLSWLHTQGEKGTFFGIIPDIAISPNTVWQGHDYVALVPYVLLVLFFGLSVWLPQFLMPGDKQQKMMAAYMAVMMLGFGWFAPAGVLLYWDVSSLWQVAQQQVTMAVVKNEHEADSGTSTDTATATEVSEKKPSNKAGKTKKKS